MSDDTPKPAPRDGSEGHSPAEPTGAGPSGGDDTTPPTDERRPSVTRVSTRNDAGAVGDRLSTGILAADASAQRGLLWQRRWLVAGAALGLVAVLGIVLGVRLSAQQAERQAREEARLQAAESSFATAVVGRAEDYEQPAVMIGEDAATLRTDLEDHLVTTDTDPAELTERVATVTEELAAGAATLTTLTGRGLPAIDPDVDVEASRAVLVELEQLRVDAEALVDELDDLVAAAPAWSTAVAELATALAAHREVVEGKPETSDPAELAEGWRSELGPLGVLETRAEAAAGVPGLEGWAGAHLAYARGTIAFVDEALTLLEEGQLDEYNALFEETFVGEDPFGFLAAARGGADAALADQPLTTAAEVAARAEVLVEQVATAERTVVAQFGDEQ